MSLLRSFTNTGPLDGTSLIVPPYVTGRVYDSRLVTPGAFATGAMVADRLYAVPFWVGPKGFAADRFAMYVGTGAGNGRIGVYTADPTTYLPTSLIVDLGQVDVSASGQKAFTISTTLTAGAPPYWVWLACVFSGTPTVGKIDLAAAMLFGDADATLAEYAEAA